MVLHGENKHVPKSSHVGIRLFCHTVTLPDRSSCAMAYRRAVNLFRKGKECDFNLWIPHFQMAPQVISQTASFHVGKHCGRTTRALHTGTPLMVAKLLSVEELFAKRSLQGYLKKMESEYNECLRAVHGDGTEEQRGEEELRARRTKVSLLAPLIHNVRELETKRKEIAETEMLLKGKSTQREEVV